MLREIIIWHRLSDPPHRNVAGFSGYVSDPTLGLGLVFPFFSNGNVMEYIRRPDVARHRRPELVNTIPQHYPVMIRLLVI